MNQELEENPEEILNDSDLSEDIVGSSDSTEKSKEGSTGLFNKIANFDLASLIPKKKPKPAEELGKEKPSTFDIIHETPTQKHKNGPI
jgi:hypothetical protein